MKNSWNADSLSGEILLWDYSLQIQQEEDRQSV